MRIVGILLAAGSGSRFGGDKLRAQLADGTPIGVRAARAMKAALAETLAVVRPEDSALAAMLQEAGAVVTACPEARLGMGASLAHAIRAAADAEGWVVGLADMPLIARSTFERIIAALERGALIVAPRYQGKRGHPVGFAAPLGARLAVLSGDTGARDILREEAERMVLIDVDDPGILADIDTPAELERAASRDRGETPGQTTG